MRKWLQALVDQFLPAVAPLQNTSAGRAEVIKWTSWMRQQWVEHGMVNLKQQRNLMTDVRRAIKTQLGEDHLALEYMNFTVAEWIAINSLIEEQVTRRNENVVLLNNPEAIVARAVRLLESREWAEVASGLVVLTGRRSSEILGTADFQPKSQWSVLFTGALKRRGEPQQLSFEIPTLTTAERVITALSKLRLICLATNLTAEQINHKYGHAVSTACDRHFSDLVPNRNGRDHLFTHLFRSVYAAIATFWYAPATVDANEYKAAIQGHYAILDTTDTTLRRSLAASRHYNDYKIADQKGNIDGRQGIKLGHGGVQVIDVFNPELREARIMELDKQAGNTIVDDAKSERDGKAIAILQQDLQQTTESASTESASTESTSEALKTLPTVMDTKMQVSESQVSEYGSKRQLSRRMKSVSVDLELLKVVAGRLDIPIRGGKGQGYDHALFELLSLLEKTEGGSRSLEQSIGSISQTVSDQAKTLAWLTSKIESLETQISQLQLENQQHLAQLSQYKEIAAMRLQDNQFLQAEIERLQIENLRLNTELQQSQSKLEGIQGFLKGEVFPTTPQKEPALASSTPVSDQLLIVPPQVSESQAVLPTDFSTPHASEEVITLQPDLDPDALRALDAIIEYNQHIATLHSQKWAISIPVMKDLLKQLGKATQPKIEAVLKAKREVIDLHHRLHGLGQRHNRVHQGHSISEFIKL
jgi:Telomere resolvase